MGDRRRRTHHRAGTERRAGLAGLDTSAPLQCCDTAGSAAATRSARWQKSPAGAHSKRRDELIARRQRQEVEGAAAWADYQEQQRAVLKQLLELRELRLARETNRTVKQGVSDRGRSLCFFELSFASE